MVFKFSLGGYAATNYWVNYKKGELHCYTSNYPFSPLPEDFLITPLEGNKSWIKLLDYLAGCRWKCYYISFVDDGIQWELRVKNKVFNLKSSGSNAYPEDFTTFIELLNNVIAESGIVIPDFT